MRLVVQVRLLPTPEQAAALEATLHAVNQAANQVSAVAFADAVGSRAALQTRLYGELKAAGLSAQPALHVIRKVADAYTTLRANLRAGNLGKPGSTRRAKAEGKPIGFRPDAAVDLLAASGHRLLTDYRFDPGTGMWRHRRRVAEPPVHLSDLRYRPDGIVWCPRSRRQANEDVLTRLPGGGEDAHGIPP